MRRQKMRKRTSKKLFSKTAGTKSRNYTTGPMRGGIRL